MAARTTAPVLLTTAEVALVVRLTPEGVRRRVHSGNFIQPIVIGKGRNSVWRFDRDELVSWLKSQKKVLSTRIHPN